MKNFLFGLVCFFQAGLASADLLSADQIKNILRAGAGMSSVQIDKVVENLEREYGMDSSNKLPISGVLVGSRFNYGFLKDRKTWNLNANFSVDNKIITVPHLFKGEFFNGGLKINFLSYDVIAIFLPAGASVENVNGLETGRGLGVDFAPGVGVFGGFVPSDIGTIGVVGLNVGVYVKSISFPKFKFRINKKYLPEYLK